MNEMPKELDPVDAFLKQVALNDNRREKAFLEGIPALKRLLAVAQQDTGQAITCRQLLLGLYNSSAFPFELTKLRGLDLDLYDDCMAVIALDVRAGVAEIQNYIEDGQELFPRWAKEMKRHEH